MAASRDRPWAEVHPRVRAQLQAQWRAHIARHPHDPWLERDRFRVEARADDPRTFLPRAPRKARTIAA